MCQAKKTMQHLKKIKIGNTSLRYDIFCSLCFAVTLSTLKVAQNSFQDLEFDRSL